MLPVLLQYRFQGVNPAWTHAWSVPWTALRMLCQFRNDLTISILPVYVPSDAEVADPKLYASNVRKMVGARLTVPLVDEGYPQAAALEKLGVHVDWSGRRVVAPPGVVDGEGRIDMALMEAAMASGKGSGGGAGKAHQS